MKIIIIFALMGVKTNLFFNYYLNPSRQHEINACLENNKKVFDNVIVVPGRPTFQELFELTKEYPNDINCFCNSDVYFKETQSLHRIMPNECFTLCRYDLIKGQEVFFNRRDSQDAWIFRGEVKPIKATFGLGNWGADNHIAWLIEQAGYVVKNPSLSIKIIHLHEKDDRDHTRNSRNTIAPPYKLIQPHYL